MDISVCKRKRRYVYRAGVQPIRTALTRVIPEHQNRRWRKIGRSDNRGEFGRDMTVSLDSSLELVCCTRSGDHIAVRRFYGAQIGYFDGFVCFRSIGCDSLDILTGYKSIFRNRLFAYEFLLTLHDKTYLHNFTCMSGIYQGIDMLA